jgi:hypothetical protein
MVEATKDMREASRAGYYPGVLLGVWRFFIPAHFEDMDMTLAKSIMDLQFHGTVLKS